MTPPLLTTKLLIPPAQPSLVWRSRLSARLLNGLSRRLTLLSAPPGYGKTTLLSAWRASTGGQAYPLAWLALDDDDNDPDTFLRYLIASLETISPSIGRAALAALEQTPAAPPRTVLMTLINSLYDIATDAALVLDDYHVITNPIVHENLAYLLDHLPPRLHLVLLTRADPPLPLARLRARGHLMEIRAADLRFTPEEAGAFLQHMELSLSSDDIAALTTRTEGWAAGLQLAALSMQGQTNLPELIRSFTGNDLYILDYLGEEVLQRQPPELQTFLLQTSVLTYLSAPLCDAVTQQVGSQPILDRLARANLFLIPIDQDRRWFRYHHLFADLLRYHLRLNHPGLEPDLYRRASAWYRRNGQLREAVRYALAGADYDHVVQLIELEAPPMLKKGDTSYTKWVTNLPNSLVKTRPRLNLLHALALLATRQWSKIDPIVNDALTAAQQEPGLTAEMVNQIEGEVASIRAHIALHHGDALQALQLAETGLNQTPPTEPDMRGVALLAYGLAAMALERFEDASQAFVKASQIADLTNNATLAFQAVRGLSRLYVKQGQVRQAAHVMKQVIQVAAENSAGSGFVYANMAELAYAMNDLDTATEYWSKAVDLCRLTDNAELLAESYLALACVRHAQARHQDAQHLREQATRVRHDYHLPLLIPHVLAEHIRLGDVETAVQWSTSAECRFTPTDNLNEALYIQYLLLARALIARQRSHDAIDLLDRLAVETRQAGRAALTIAAYIFLALAHNEEGHPETALATLTQALVMAEPIGYIRLFVDQGPVIADLLRRLELEDWKLEDYVERLLAAFPVSDRVAPSPNGATLPASHPASQPHSPQEGQPPAPRVSPSSLTVTLIEPLSERELEVLRLLIAGASNREIARRLYLALGTVKTHIHHIYGKLGVESRVQAIVRCRELGIT